MISEQVGVYRRKTHRKHRGNFEIVTLVLGVVSGTARRDITEEEYGSFLDLRTDESGNIRTGKSAPTILVEGRARYCSYEREV